MISEATWSRRGSGAAVGLLPVRHFGLALALGLGLAFPLAGQAPRPLTADEAVRLGLERNPELRAARADADAARAGYGQARAGMLPALRAQGNYSRLSNNIPAVEFTIPGTDSTVVFQAVELNRYDAELTLEQPLFAGFRLQNRTKAAGARAEAASHMLEQTRADVAYAIRRAYWTLSRALAVRAGLQTAQAQVEDHLKQVRNRVAEGSALRRDVLAAETRRSEVALERVEAENAVRVGQLELNRLIGLPLDTAVVPAPDSAAAIAGGVDAVSLDSALTDRPELRARTAEVRGLRAQLRAAQGGFLPELSLVGRYVNARPNPYFFSEQDRWHRTWELGLSAHWNLWEGGRANAEVAEARAQLEAAEARLTDLRERLRVDVARQELEVRRALDAVEAANLNLAAATESFRVARQQYGEGAALSSDVLDAEQAHRQAEARRAGALADAAIARAGLLDALGRVW